MKYLFLLLFVPFCLANFTINSTETQDAFLTLNFGECYTDVATNNTFCAPDEPIFSCQLNCSLNQSINLNYSQNYSNSILNLSVFAPVYPKANQNISLNYGDIYSNSSLNLTVNAPIYPSIGQMNKNITLGYNDSYYNSTLNLTITSPLYPKENKNISLNFGDSYTNQTINLTITAPLFPKANQNISINCGDSYNNNTLNLSINTIKPNLFLTLIANSSYVNSNLNQTINCNYSGAVQQCVNQTIVPKYNVSLELGEQDTYTNNDANISISCKLQELNVEEHLSLGGSYENTLRKILIYAPDKPNLNVNSKLDGGQSYFNSEYGINVYCRETVAKDCPTQQECPVCQTSQTTQVQSFSSNLTNCSIFMNMSNNQVCADNLFTLCSPDEIKTNDWKTCFTRNDKICQDNSSNLAVQLKTTSDSYDKDKTTLKAYETGTIQQEQFVQGLTIVAIVGVVLGIVIFYFAFVYKNQAPRVNGSVKTVEDLGKVRKLNEMLKEKEFVDNFSKTITNNVWNSLMEKNKGVKE